MKRWMALFPLLALTLGYSCFFASKSRPLPPLSAETITAESLWTRISSEDPYRKWSQWPDHRGIQAGKAPHGPFHTIYVNDAISKAAPFPDKTIPAGGIVAKNAFGFDKELSHIAVMVKLPGYHPEEGDWFYAEYSPEGKSLVPAGKTAMCISCHKAYKSNDYLVIHDLDK